MTCRAVYVRSAVLSRNPPSVRRSPVTRAFELHRQVEGGGVVAQVVGDRLLARIGAGRRRERQAGQGVVLGRGEQPQRLPPRAPGVPELPGRLQDQEPQPLPAQVPGGGQTGLPAADDDDVVRLDRRRS